MHHFCLALPRTCQEQGDPTLATRVVDVLISNGFDGAKTVFLRAPFEGYARSVAERVDIPFDNEATIAEGLNIIMKRWYTQEINADKVDMVSFKINFMYMTASPERQANNTSRLLVQFLRSGKLRSNSQISNNDQNVDSFVTDVTEMLAGDCWIAEDCWLRNSGCTNLAAI